MTHIQVITVQDTTPPVFLETLPPNVLADCDNVPPAVVLTATDNCITPIVIFTEIRTDGNCPYNYVLTRTWSVTDSCDNETVHVQIVTVQDTTHPVFIEDLPDDELVNCDDIPTADTLTATDNCSDVTVLYNEVRTDGNCPFNYILTRTWSVTDECDNATVHVQIVTVQDTTHPVFVEFLPQDSTVNCDAIPVADVLTLSLIHISEPTRPY